MTTTKTSHGKVNSFFFSFYRDYSNSLTLSNASELFRSWISISHIQLHEKNEFCHCLFTSFTKHDRLGIFTGSCTVDGKEMYTERIVMHVQSLFFCLFKLLLIWLSRRRCILNFLYYLQYIVTSQKRNILGANWITPADSIPSVFSTHR